MSMRWLEILAAAKEDLHEMLIDPSRYDELPARLQKLVTRARGSGYTDLDGTDRWYLWRFWAEAPEGFDEFDDQDPTVRWIDATFSQEHHWLRMFSVWWWHTGMMVGTQYASGINGEAGDVDLEQPPLWPWDYVQAKKFIPDLIIYDRDDDGNLIEPPTVYNLVHDMIPNMITTGQHSESRGRDHVKRRVMQETSNQKLGADAFGVDPWSPAVAKARRR